MALSEADIAELLEKNPGWSVEDGYLVRRVEAATFMSGIELVRMVAEVAELQNHHPDIDIRWRTVTFRVMSHDEGALTSRDAVLVRAIQALIS